MIAAPQSGTRQCRGGQIEHRRTTMKRHGRLVAGFVLLALAVGLVAPAPAQEKPWWPFPVEDRDPPFNMEGKKLKKDYIPIDHAAKKWNMCVSFPHMKDAYWIAVDYGAGGGAGGRCGPVKRRNPPRPPHPPSGRRPSTESKNPRPPVPQQSDTALFLYKIQQQI